MRETHSGKKTKNGGVSGQSKTWTKQELDVSKDSYTAFSYTTLGNIELKPFPG